MGALFGISQWYDSKDRAQRFCLSVHTHNNLNIKLSRRVGGVAVVVLIVRGSSSSSRVRGCRLRVLCFEFPSANGAGVAHAQPTLHTIRMKSVLATQLQYLLVQNILFFTDGAVLLAIYIILTHFYEFLCIYNVFLCRFASMITTSKLKETIQNVVKTTVHNVIARISNTIERGWSRLKKLLHHHLEGKLSVGVCEDLMKRNHERWLVYVLLVV